MDGLTLKVGDRCVTVNLIWLRDNCKCDECYCWNTHQRKKDHSDINVKIKKYIIENNIVRVTWYDDHVSIYEFDWINRQVSYELQPNAILWTQEEIERQIPIIDSKNNELTEQAETNLVTGLLEFGVALVKNVTPTIEATEKLATHIGPVMETLFGGMWEIKLEDMRQYKDTAYTTQSLIPHTDNTYFIEPAGLMVFHCLKPAEKGGETILIDGFKAAELLKLHNNQFYNCLRTTPVEWQYISDNHNLKHVSTILKTRAFSNDLEQIRLNMYDRSARVPFTNNLDLFYKSLHCFRSILNDECLQWKIQLAPGTALFINNWRIMHGRNRFVGIRNLVGCYQAMGTLLSKARKLRIIR